MSRFGALYESSMWIAERAYSQVQLLNAPTGHEVLRALANEVVTASYEKRLALIRAYPDITGKTRLQENLAAESMQVAVWLDEGTPSELEKFQALNHQYKAKFDFPFIMVVDQVSHREVLAAFEQRLNNHINDEFITAIDHISYITKLRMITLLENE